MKCVIVVNGELPIGLVANTSAVLAMSMGKHHAHVVGPDVHDQDGHVHRGITQIPIPLLHGSHDMIKSLREQVLSDPSDDVYMVDVCDIAQKSKHYDEYAANLAATPADELRYFGIGLIGSAKRIKMLTGAVPLLK